MMACCNYTYEQYIDPTTREIDIAAYNEAVKKVHGENAILLKEGEWIGVVCRCRCHTKGVRCLH